MTMKTIYKVSFITTYFLLALGTIYLSFRNLQLRKQQSNTVQEVIHKVDTVYLDKPFKVDPSYKDISTPSKVYVYNCGFDKDTVNTNTDSLIQFKLNKNLLDLTLYNTFDSSVYTKQYSIDLDKYQYLYNNGVLTQKKKLGIKLTPYITSRIRPINQLYDLGAGISLISSKRHFSYNVGFNLGYYPKLSNKLQKDVEVSITYNF